MSIERCEKHSRHYDTDKVEECPLCLDEQVDALVAGIEADWSNVTGEA